MQRKVALIIAAILVMITASSLFLVVEANATENVLETEQATELIEMKESTKGKLAEYVEKYGSTTFGIVGYALNVIRIYSIPFCFIGFAVGSIYQYVIGIRKLDIRDRGFMLIISILSLICGIILEVVVKKHRQLFELFLLRTKNDK